MEGVGARLGRSSTRYGPTAAVFSGPVRRWKKRWVQLSSPSSNAASLPTNGDGGGSYPSLLLLRWTPLSSTATPSDGAGAGKGAAAVVAEAAAEGPPRKKFRYVPVSGIEEQKQDDATKAEYETKPGDADASPLTMQSDGSDDKPDVNDALKE